MKLAHTALILGLIALMGATAYAQAPADDGKDEGDQGPATRTETPAEGAKGGSEGDQDGSGAVSEKLKSDALQSLIDGGKADRPAARRDDDASRPSRSEGTTRRAEPSRRDSSSRSGRGSSTGRSSSGAVPIVPSSPTDTVAIPRDARSRRDTAPASTNVEASAEPPADTTNVLVPEPTDADLQPPEAPNTDDTALPDGYDTGDAGALNAGVPAETANMPAAGAPGSKSPASAILVGVLVLAGLLIAAAVVVTVLSSNKAAAPVEPHEAPSAVAPPVPQYAYLTAPDAPNIPVSATPFVMGSSQACDLRLADPKASPQHAELDRTDEGWVLTDLGSLNGTFLNGERIASPVILRAGDELRMGDIVVGFETED